MGKKSDHIFNCLKWVIAVAAYVFLFYKLLTFKDYEAVFTLFRQSNCLWLIGAVLLLPLNILIESMKWKLLVSPVHHVSLRESIKMILWGNTGGFSTPNRLGEFPARSMMMPEGTRAKSIALGFIGSLAQTICILCCGIVSFHFFYHIFINHSSNGMLWSIQSEHDILFGYVVVILFLIAFFLTLPHWTHLLRNSGNKTIRQLNETATSINYAYLLKTFLLAGIRYLVFSFQSYCMYRFCMVDVTLQEALIAIPTFYLFVTLTPSINISEMAVRGSYAAFIFRCFTPNYFGAIIASSLTWLINFCIPMLIGSLFVKFIKK